MRYWLDLFTLYIWTHAFRDAVPGALRGEPFLLLGDRRRPGNFFCSRGALAEAPAARKFPALFATLEKTDAVEGAT